jgi:hypothetical protein
MAACQQLVPAGGEGATAGSLTDAADAISIIAEALEAGAQLVADYEATPSGVAKPAARGAVPATVEELCSAVASMYLEVRAARWRACRGSGCSGCSSRRLGRAAGSAARLVQRAAAAGAAALRVAQGMFLLRAYALVQRYCRRHATCWQALAPAFQLHGVDLRAMVEAAELQQVCRQGACLCRQDGGRGGAGGLEGAMELLAARTARTSPAAPRGARWHRPGLRSTVGGGRRLGSVAPPAAPGGAATGTGRCTGRHPRACCCCCCGTPPSRSGARLAQAALRDLDDEAGWTLVRDGELRLLHRHEPGAAVHSFKGECTLQVRAGGRAAQRSGRLWRCRAQGHPPRPATHPGLPGALALLEQLAELACRGGGRH